MPRNWSWGKKRKDGYRSGLESDIAGDLKAKGRDFGYEDTKLSYLRRVAKGECGACGTNRVHQRLTYTPDFHVGDIFLEVKGRFTATDRGKMLAVKASNPTVDIRLIFALDNKLQKNSETRYSDWAEKHGFKYHVGRQVPQEWLSKETKRTKRTKG